MKGEDIMANKWKYRLYVLAAAAFVTTLTAYIITIVYIAYHFITKYW